MIPIEKISIILNTLNNKKNDLIGNINLRLNSEDATSSNLNEIENLFKELTLNGLTSHEIQIMTNNSENKQETQE